MHFSHKTQILSQFRFNIFNIIAQLVSLPTTLVQTEVSDYFSTIKLLCYVLPVPSVEYNTEQDVWEHSVDVTLLLGNIGSLYIYIYLSLFSQQQSTL